MAQPTNREEFKDYCLRKLGWPVIEINVSPEQVEDRIDDALDKFHEYHFDGVEEDHYVVTLTDTDAANNYIELPDKIFSVIRVYPFDSSSSGGGDDLFNAQYQFYLNDFFGGDGAMAVSGNLSYYYQMKSYITELQNILSPANSFTFNRKTNRVYFAESVTSIKASASKLLFKVYKKLDGATGFAQIEIWQDMFLKSYATALIKKQWGSNIKKFGSVPLPGGVTLNGDAIFAEAVEEIAALEQELVNDLQLPYDFTIG